jgi:hypothetical protein
MPFAGMQNLRQYAQPAALRRTAKLPVSDKPATARFKKHLKIKLIFNKHQCFITHQLVNIIFYVNHVFTFTFSPQKIFSNQLEYLL